MKKVTVGKAINRQKTRYIEIAELPVIDTETRETLFKLTTEFFSDRSEAWLCWPPMPSFRAKRKFSNDTEFLEALEYILKECMVEWDKENQEELNPV